MAPTAAPEAKEAQAVPLYHNDLRADIKTVVGDAPKVQVHRVEWRKVMAGEPVEINASVGQGFRVMSVDEWAARWKKNDDFPDCLACGGTNTKEHAFSQTWCRGRKHWEAESLCLDCHWFSYRSYRDPDYLTPEQYEKQRWEAIVRGGGDDGAGAVAQAITA